MRFCRLWIFISLLVTSLAQAQVDTTKSIWTIRTIDSVGLNELMPMISQYYPPKIYAKWLIDIATCEGLPLPSIDQISKLTFWEVNAESFQINADTTMVLLGVVDGSNNRVYIAYPQIWDKETISHEFLHMLLRWNFGEKYRNQHPLEYFGKCHMHVSRG
jgi:hypothetical protein